jgi:hypothetical protein
MVDLKSQNELELLANWDYHVPIVTLLVTLRTW